MPAEGTVLMEGAEVVFRNFTGKEGPYNREGDRNFCVILPPDLADQMAADGWNIKQLRGREEGDDPKAYIQVSVSFKRRAPLLVMITSRGRTTIEDEEDCELFDYVDIQNVDLIIRPYNWEMNGKTGVKAYLQSFYITIREDALMLKYQDVPVIGAPERQLEIESGRPHADWEGEVVD